MSFQEKFLNFSKVFRIMNSVLLKISCEGAKLKAYAVWCLMPYPCSRFYADIKTDIRFDNRFDNRFDIRLWNSIHVKHTIDFVTKLRFMVWFNMEAIPKSDIKTVIKSDISFDISIKPTTWIGHKSLLSKYIYCGLDLRFQGQEFILSTGSSIDSLSPH